MDGNDEKEKIYKLFLELKNPLTRDYAIVQLNKKRNFPYFAELIWSTEGVINELFKEVINTDPESTLDLQTCNRVCCVMSILYCITSDIQIKHRIVSHKLMHYLYPFVIATSQTHITDYLRLISLGVISYSLKDSDDDDLYQILHTSIVPVLLRAMDSDSDMSRTLATLTLRHILETRIGLEFVCTSFNRLKYICITLDKLVRSLAKVPSIRLLKDVIGCYICLTGNEKARNSLIIILPSQLRNRTFDEWIIEHPYIRKLLSLLLTSLFPMGDYEGEAYGFSL